MKRSLLSVILSLLIFHKTYGQTIYKPQYLNYQIDSLTKNSILNSLDTLFSQIESNKLDTLLLGKGSGDFNVLKSFKDVEDNKKASIRNFYKKQLINIYPIATNQYWISLAFIGLKNTELPILKAII